MPGPGPENYVEILTANPFTRPGVYNPEAYGPAIFTADQVDFRNISAGFDGDPVNYLEPEQFAQGGGGHSTVFALQRHPDGTLDSSRLECSDKGWLDTRAKMPSDFRAVTP